MANPLPQHCLAEIPEKFFSCVLSEVLFPPCSDAVSSGVLREARWGSGATWEEGNRGKHQQCDKRTPRLTFKAGPHDSVWNLVLTSIHSE